jgi:hypothetical protein
MHVDIRTMLVDVTGRMAADGGRQQDQTEQSTKQFHAYLLC